MKNKIIYSLNLLWTCIIAFTFPVCFGLIFLDITGHSKGYGYDLGAEKDVSVMFGCVELLFWLALALPSNIYVFRKAAKNNKRYMLILAALYIALAVVCILITGGWNEYLKGVFNVDNADPAEILEETTMNKKFPFEDKPNTACFTCCHVLDERKPILYVSHDEDGYWQFLCGGRHTEEDARIVSLANILEIDETVAALSQLDYGEYAEAGDGTDDWIIKEKHSTPSQEMQQAIYESEHGVNLYGPYDTAEDAVKAMPED